MSITPRILFNAKDAPWIASGYGVITKHLVPRLADHYGKDNIFVYAPVFQRDEIRDWGGIKVLPGISADFGEDMIEAHYNHFNCNMLLQVGDWLQLKTVPQLAAENKIVWVQWAPFDFLNFPDWARGAMQFCKLIVPFSKQAERVFRDTGLENVASAIWLGLDLNIWKPIDRRDYPPTMKKLGFSEDTYNILMVQANQSRKYIRESLEGIKHFREAYPGANVKLYLHTHMGRGGERALNLDILELGLGETVSFPDEYAMTLGGAPEEQMALVFNCADLVLDICMEGFGLSQTQAQACGIPVICMSEGAGPELVKWGVQVPSYSIDRSQQVMKPVPHPAQIATAIETMYLAYKESKVRNSTAIEFVRENFSWDKIAAEWINTIDKVMDMAEKYSWYIPSPSEELIAKSKEVTEVSA